MSAAIALGDITAAFAGTVRATDVDGIDVDLDVSGASLADLKKLAPLNLPNTPPYRLQGRFRNPARRVHLRSVLGPRRRQRSLRRARRTRAAESGPLLKANLVSTLLDLDDLGPLVGAPPKTGAGETAAPKQKQQVQEIDATGKVLPQKRFAVEDWPIMDADVRFKGKKIVDAAHSADRGALARTGSWKPACCASSRCKFRIADGTVNANIRLDSNQKPLAGKVNMDVTGVNLRKLVPGEGKMQDPLGTALRPHRHHRARHVGRGALRHARTARIAMLVNGGQVSNLLMELVGLDVAEALRILATKDPNVQLRCAVVDLSIKDGVATPQVFVIDTTDTVVSVTGTIDFRTETLDLVTRAEPKDPSPFVLRTPINVKGGVQEARA